MTIGERFAGWRWSPALAVSGWVLILAAGLPLPARAATLPTGDGLALRVDDRTGVVDGIEVDGKPLPLAADAPSGLSYREFLGVEKRPPKALVGIPFEAEGEGWVPAARVGNAGEPVAAARRDDGGAEGSHGYVRLGDKERYGHGIALRDPVAVEAGDNCEISWFGRVPAASATFILYVRVFDGEGRDVTEQAPPPAGWLYSPYSKTHYQCEIPASEAGTWQKVTRTYRVPEGAARVDVALCLWRGAYVDVDLLRVTRTTSVRWGPWTPVSGAVRRAGAAWRQSASSPDGQLRFEVEYTPDRECLRTGVRVRDLSKPPRNRALRIRYSLPVAAAGWTWDDDILSSRRVDASDTGPARGGARAGRGDVYGNSFSVGGHPVSRYPFTSLHREAVGLSLAAPMDVPRLQGFAADASGLYTEVDLGLSAATAKGGPGQASFSLLLYRHDGTWGFRSALEKYYRLFPEWFANRTGRFGGWGWPVAPGKIAGVEDFGVSFLECGPLADNEYAVCRQKGILTFHYMEPRGLRQVHRGVREREAVPSWERAVADLKAWAAEGESTEVWARAPRPVTARALLNSLVTDSSGRPEYVVDYWDIYSHWWLTNPDPDLPAPNRAGLAFDYELGASLEKVDGVYVDSVSLLDRENGRKEHLAVADLPLSFSLETGEPVIAADLSTYEFLTWLSGRLHARGKYVMQNLFAPAQRFYAHLADVSGCEVAGLQTDSEAMLQRAYAGRRPVTNLLQYQWAVFKRVPEMTHAQVEAYLQQQTFYAFAAGISTIGGGTEPGYAGMKRYFRTPEQYERDRDLFRRYVPVTRRLAEAGWEPVTQARVEPAEVRVERYGRWEEGNLYFALRNTATEPRSACLRLTMPDGSPKVTAEDVLAGRPLTVAASVGTGLIERRLDPGETVVIAVRSP